MNNFQYSELKRAYETPGNPGYLGGVDVLYELFKPRFSRKDVRNFLQTRNSYTRFRDVRRKFPRNKYYRGHRRYMIQGDLYEIPQLSKKTGFRFVFVIINVFTRKVKLIPLIDKTAPTVCSAMRSYLEKNRGFYIFSSDRGAEFKSKCFRKLLKENNILQRFPRTFFKAPFAERSIREVGKYLRKSFALNKTKKFLNRIQEIELLLNQRKHRGLLNSELSPLEAEQPEHQKNLLLQQKFELMLENEKINQRKPSSIKVHSIVRVVYNAPAFRKGYKARFTKQLFKVIHVEQHREKRLYFLETYPQGQQIDGAFYFEELSKVHV